MSEIHIENVTSETTVLAGDLPLTPQQIEKLVQIVMVRLKEAQQQGKKSREATAVRSQATPSLPFES
ncbi:MAG: hypothetical protein R3293_06815 [Candidatus Promineifilaceae bacterium]|nr:hypothetical protein [Candidatus Promineifilaceae bacterium]